MTRRSGALLLVGASLTFPACAVIDAQTGTKALSQASGAACNVARNDMLRAIEAYSLLESKPPKSEAELVPGYLLGLSPLMDIDAHGNVVAAPESGCP